MKNYICSHAGKTEFCVDCKFTAPFSGPKNLHCAYEVRAEKEEINFPLYYKQDASYYFFKSANLAVKFTLYEHTFFASVISDKFQLASVFGNGQRISVEEFETCTALVSDILKHADMQIATSSSLVYETDSSSFL